MSADGKWNITLNTPMGARSSELTVKTSGATFTGTAAMEGQNLEIAGKVEGDTLIWSMNITQPMPIALEFTAKIAGDDLSGSAKAGAFGSFPLTGKRA